MLKFSWVVVGFLGTIFANIKVLQVGSAGERGKKGKRVSRGYSHTLPSNPQNSNVETFITFRASTPIVLSVCDYVFLGRTWPNVSVGKDGVTSL